LFWLSIPLLSQVLGKTIDEKPPVTGITLKLRHDLHIAVTCVALELNVDAPITIPGIRTSLPIKSDYIYKQFFFSDAGRERDEKKKVKLSPYVQITNLNNISIGFKCYLTIRYIQV
jgi:hypothetical protein